MEVSRKMGFFTNRRDKKLFYSLVMPDKYSRVWVFCNPFLEEKTYTQSVYKYFADFLVRSGDAVIRFDYQGDGDSEGILEDIDLDDWCDDIVDATKFVGNICNNPSFNLFGLRLGGSLAWNVARKIKIDQILLWDPIIDGDDYLNQLLRFNLTAQLSTYGKVKEDRSVLRQNLKEGKVVNILGYEVNARLSNSLSNIQLSNKITPESDINIVISSMSSNPTPAPSLLTLVDGSLIKLSAVKTRPFWHEPRFNDVRQQTLIDASMLLLNGTNDTEHSVCK